jgi:hypothetical protein
MATYQGGGVGVVDSSSRSEAAKPSAKLNVQCSKLKMIVIHIFVSLVSN